MTMRRRIAVISPVVSTGAIDVEATIEELRSPTVEIENFFLGSGPASIEDEEDIAACLPGLLEVSGNVIAAEWHSIVINCMCDPGVAQLRALSALPVFGPAETAMHTIAAAGGRFSVLDVVAEGRDFVERQVIAYGLSHHYISHRGIGIPVLDIFADRKGTLKALETAALAALEDGADSLLLGCTGLSELAMGLREILAVRGVRAPVVEPFALTVRVASAFLEALVPQEDAESSHP